MAESEQSCQAVIFIVQETTQARTIVRELQDLARGLSSSPRLIVLSGHSVSSDFKKELVHNLTSSFPSINPEKIISTNATFPAEWGFGIKSIMDSNRINKLVILVNEESLATILVLTDVIFTSGYDLKVKLYGKSFVDIPAMLKNEQDLKSDIKEKCSQYLKEFTVNPEETLEILTSDHICNKVFLHGFSTRKGGCSTYPAVASLNLSYKPDKRDPVVTVDENRCRLLKAIGASDHKFQLAKAAHGNVVWTVGCPEPAEYDAIICDTPGVIIAAPAADCVTIILADAIRSVCAAVHSGWKGILGNVSGVTVRKITECFGCSIQDIKAVIGPSIGVCCFEVREDVKELFCENSLLKQCVKVVEGKYTCKMHIDLQKAITLQLEEAGISNEHIDDSLSKLCTYCNRDRFFSYRRDGRPFGTHVGFIGLR